MTVPILSAALVMLLAAPHTALVQNAPTPPSSALAFTRVYPLDTPGLTPPVLVRASRLSYTPEAMRAKIQGTVELVITVGADGGVRDALVSKSLDAATGLDDEAVAASAQAFYKPGMLNGKPVAVRLTMTLSAKLH
jgi:TonB family protein